MNKKTVKSEITQEKRDEFLKYIDATDDCTNEALFYYDLTPYYRDNDEKSLFDLLIDYTQEKRKMAYNSKMSLTPEQNRIYNQIKNDGRYAISARTSFGKTTLIKELIMEQEPQFVIYIVPTISLENELIQEFKVLYEKKGYIVFDSLSNQNQLPPKFIFIGTQEKFMEINAIFNFNIDLFVIDEAYKLLDKEDGGRIIQLNRLFFDRVQKNKKLILLLPLVNSIKGLEKYNIDFIQSDYSPVTHKFFALESKKLVEKFFELSDIEEKTLVYFSSPEKVNNFFLTNIDRFVSRNLNKQDARFIKRVETDFHPEWLPIVAYKHNIGMHYGPMPKFMQDKMVKNFLKKENELKMLLITTSLIEGVNTPTKNIIIYDDMIFDKKYYVKYKNLIGRAGRLGQYMVGNIYYNEKYQDQFNQIDVDWRTQNFELFIDNENTIEQINRGGDINLLNSEITKYELNKSELIELINRHTYSIDKIKQLINTLIIDKEIITKIAQQNKLKNVQYLSFIIDPDSFKHSYYLQLAGLDKKCNNWAMGYAYSIVLNNYSEAKTIAYQLKWIKDQLDNRVSNISDYISGANTSKLISYIINLMYNEFPYKIIPLFSFLLDLNILFSKAGHILIANEVVNYLNKIIKYYNKKYLGDENADEKTRIIVRKLFDFGIPAHITSTLNLSYIVKNTPDYFSIWDIKKCISQNPEFEDLYSIYFK